MSDVIGFPNYGKDESIIDVSKLDFFITGSVVKTKSMTFYPKTNRFFFTKNGFEFIKDFCDHSNIPRCRLARDRETSRLFIIMDNRGEYKVSMSGKQHGFKCVSFNNDNVLSSEFYYDFEIIPVAASVNGVFELKPINIRPAKNSKPTNKGITTGNTKLPDPKDLVKSILSKRGE